MPGPHAFQPLGPGEERFEVVSRGDPVPGRLWLGADAAPAALVLIVPPIGMGKDAREVARLGPAIAAAGWAAASIDLPLHGEHASPKLSERLMRAAPLARTGSDRLLWDEFVRQTARDLACVRRALVLRPRLAAAPAAVLAHTSLAEPAEAFAASDPSVRLLRSDRLDVPSAIIDALRSGLALR